MWREGTSANALAGRRDLLERTIAALEEELGAPADEEEEERAKVHEQLKTRHAELWAVGVAEEKLRKGVYGLCADCGGRIEAWILRAVPEAWLCAGCDSAAQRWR